jgi:hypothetical protein
VREEWEGVVGVCQGNAPTSTCRCVLIQVRPPLFFWVGGVVAVAILTS